MQIRHLKSIIPAADLPSRITALAWSPNNQKLAVVGSDKVVQLFDETGERKDRFATKPADPKAGKSYYVCAMAFSPDSTKLAIAQSDCIVFVYKLGLEWGEKKSICNKLIQTAEITCLTWPKEQHNALVFGMADGKVRVGNLKTNKAATLYQSESCVISASSSVDGNAIITGHMDGSINRFFFDDGISGASQGKFVTHRCPPSALGWGEMVVAAGTDRCVVFYDNEGRVAQEFDYSRDDEEQDFTVAEFSPSGQSVVIGSFNRFHIYNYQSSKGTWEEAPVKIIENFYTVSSLAWKPDGSRLVVGSMCGAVELFDCCLRRSKYKGKFEFTYVSPSQVIVKRLSTGSRIVLKSHYGYEIQKVNIFQDQYLIANTPDTLLMGDLASCKLSEIPWQGSSNEKFYFENPQVCMVFNAGELSIVEYPFCRCCCYLTLAFPTGCICANPRSLFPAFILNHSTRGRLDASLSPSNPYYHGHYHNHHRNHPSVRLNERRSDEEVKRIAYLIDLQTIHILDLTNGLNIADINHNANIDWLELSGKANKLLFRDKRRQLHLYDINTQTRTTLLHYCSYWVPNSDVVCAQSRSNLCIWYSIDSPERVTMFPIKGEVEDIERSAGRTEVIVDEGVNTVSYTLDEGLIEFGSALEDKDYERAVFLLETLELTPETEAMWKTLSTMALKDQRLPIAERCYAALGDVAKTHYLHKLNIQIDEFKLEGHIDEMMHYAVRAKLAILEKQFMAAEQIYLDQEKIEEAMEMYQDMHKWDLSIKVAEAKNHPELETLRRNYFSWLLESNQEDKAGELKEEEGDYIAAANLYLKGGMPARAAVLLAQHNLSSNIEITERVAAALFKSGLYEKAGELYEKLGSADRAIDAYKKGKAFRAAVELSRLLFPQEVIHLEEQWGDHLVSQKQMDAAINHYIEAGCSLKAIEAAIASKQWRKATSIVDSLQPIESGRPYLIQLAKHFAETHDYALAEKYFVAYGRPQDAVDMYTSAGKWEKAHGLATTYMSAEEDAEKLYLTVGEPDLAINMYKNHKQYDQMIRLVTSYHKDLLIETHLYLAKTLETEGNFKQAEHHYIEGKDWKSAINMYCANNMYEDAYRIGKAYGGPNSAKQVAYLWARSLGGESAVKLLTKFGLLDAAIDFATENGAFDFAFELSRFADKYKLADVHYKHAMFLEDEGKFPEAEAAFILAGKPKEAILMYIHNENWDAALTVAETYEPNSVAEVLIGQAKVVFDKKEYTKAECLLLRAQRPDIAIKLYKDANMWKEAINFTKEYLPHKVAEIHDEYDRYVSGQNHSGRDEMLAAARMLEQQKDYSRAIDVYLKMTPSQTNNIEFLEELWEKAVELAMKFVPERGQEVVAAVGSRLIEIKRYQHAAEFFAGVELYKDAIDAYVMGGLWDKARAVLTLAPKYSEYVENAYVAHLKKQGKAEVLVNVDAAAGIDLYASRGEWDKCLEKASQQGSDILGKYLITYSIAMIKEGKFEQCVQTILKWGIFTTSSHLDVYARLSREIFHQRAPTAVASLKDLLFKLIHGSTLQPQSNLNPEFHTFLFIAHLLNLRNYCSKKRELAYFVAKQSISLLRYSRDIPADRAFFEAGEAAKSAGMNAMAFVCWNRYIDISEAIEEGDASLLENADFENTDVPFDIELPEEIYQASESRREEVRDWVLQVSLDQKTAQEVDRRDCEECNAKLYDASLVCYNCHTTHEPCVITGYPVLRNKVKCPTCNRHANKEDWNTFVMAERVCPWCMSAQAPIYFSH
ncbi:uncharacterized protein BJ171DRAFT_584638 [Polychytrium aggregatum]|uniref:uncharacterized protein n=1 Tax=Polychytrium aggregatum TaxID=110093 RepID=UPI0022FF1660|nr:uncharacterized protein BJ171DRAFT_584638 [Polychytrium aggregatum]KAI9201990.1 hypothetical protein BJ171DRAFT_584638 [Polychytrium aggregatum]